MERALQRLTSQDYAQSLRRNDKSRYMIEHMIFKSRYLTGNRMVMSKYMTAEATQGKLLQVLQHWHVQVTDIQESVLLVSLRVAVNA